MLLPFSFRSLWLMPLAALGLTLSACRPPPPPASFPHWYAPELKAAGQQLLCEINARCERFQLLLIDDERLNAEIRLGYQIVLSRGLLSRLHSEDELAFVIAHELGHQALGHRVPRILSHRLPIELEADRFAAERLCALGREPSAGHALLQRLQSSEPAGDAAEGYPRDELQTRLAQSFDCNPPSRTSARRDDLAFRALLDRALAVDQVNGEATR